MPPHHHHHHHETVRFSGEVLHLFAHRFVIRTEAETILADLTPHGAAAVELHIGDIVTIEGEQKPSEVKVSKLQRDKHTFVITGPEHHHGPEHAHPHEPADREIAVKSAKAAGYAVIGEPRRKPKHFEILGQKGASIEELHIELNGHIRKAKPVAMHDGKWNAEISTMHHA